MTHEFFKKYFPKLKKKKKCSQKINFDLSQKESETVMPQRKIKQHYNNQLQQCVACTTKCLEVEEGLEN